jgi:hypothetical protein
MSPSKPEPSATGYLPTSAYFAAGAGPACNTLRSNLTGSGFTNVTCPSDSEKAAEFYITPPGGTKTKISPPGTTPKQAYDLTSAIQVIGAGPQRPR